jgi:hypothetical protein
VSFPKSTEKSRYFLFPNKNVRDALTFSVLDDATGKVISTSVTRPKGRSPHINNRSANWDPFVLRDVKNQNMPHKTSLQLQEEPIKDDRRYKLKYKPRKWTNKKYKGKLKESSEHAPTSNIPETINDSSEVHPPEEILNPPLFIVDVSQIGEIVDANQDGNNMDLRRRSTRLKRRPTRFVTAETSMAKRVLMSAVRSVITSPTRKFCSQVGTDTLPEPTRAPMLPQEEDVFYGRLFNDIDLRKLRELTAIDRLNEIRDNDWGV